MELTAPLITALYAGLNGLVALWLAINVTRNRAKHDVDIGDGGNAEMHRVVRVHGNNSEYTPLALVLLAIIEIVGAPSLAIHVLGIGLLVARVWHAQGLYSSPGRSMGRLVGQTVTWLVIFLASLYAIYLFFAGGMPNHM